MEFFLGSLVFSLKQSTPPSYVLHFYMFSGKFVCAATSPVERQGEFGHSLAFMVFELAARVFPRMPMCVHGRRRGDAGVITASWLGLGIFENISGESLLGKNLCGTLLEELCRNKFAGDKFDPFDLGFYFIQEKLMKNTILKKKLFLFYFLV